MIRHLQLTQLMWLVGLVTLAMVGCSGDEHPAPAPFEGSSTPTASTHSGAAGDTSDAGSTCEDLQVRECHVVLGAQGSVQNCFVGLQLCTKGEWGPCVDAAEVEAALN